MHGTFDGKEFGQVIVESIKAYVDRRCAALETKIALLEQELQAAGIRYVGAYQRAQTYKRGAVCTQDGSMWCAVSDVGPNEQPGRSQVWQLCCRAGRDGKDARGAA